MGSRAGPPRTRRNLPKPYKMFYSQRKNVPMKLQPQFHKQMESNDKQLEGKIRNALQERACKTILEPTFQIVQRPVHLRASLKEGRAELLDIPKGLSPHTLKTFVPGCISKDNFDIMLSSCPIDLLMSTAFLLQMPSNVLHVYSLPQLLQINMRPLNQGFVSGAEVTTPPLLIRQGHLPELPDTVKGKNTAL